MNYDDEDDYAPSTNLPKPTYSGTLESDGGQINKRIELAEEAPYLDRTDPSIRYGNQYPYYPSVPAPPQSYMNYPQPMQLPYFNNFQWPIQQSPMPQHPIIQNPMTQHLMSQQPMSQNQISQHHMSQQPMQAYQQNFGYNQPNSKELSEQPWNKYNNVKVPQPYIDNPESVTTNNTRKSETLKKNEETVKKISSVKREAEVLKEQSTKRSKIKTEDSLESERKFKENLAENTDKVLIPGTSITLETDEDIKKWKEERRKMWLLRISNRRKEHMEKMGLKEEDVKKSGNPLKESKKEQQFIKSIQAQVARSNPKANLNLKLVQRGFAEENAKLLDFIVELGECGYLEYELSQEEKDKLFGGPITTGGNNNRNFNKGRRQYQQKPSEGSRYNQPPAK
ncbi:Ribosome assembly 1 protein [Nakaseomyces bracarensis]|uniref:Ribosome assembly 1 protein n=1 Tax=Nakaseomyces bracarensis TaxID=273131 RepID=A0ABR4NVR0_9SACH